MPEMIEIQPKCSKCGYVSDYVFRGRDYMREVKPQLMAAGWRVRVKPGSFEISCPECNGVEGKPKRVVTVP